MPPISSGSEAIGITDAQGQCQPVGADHGELSRSQSETTPDPWFLADDMRIEQWMASFVRITSTVFDTTKSVLIESLMLYHNNWTIYLGLHVVRDRASYKSITLFRFSLPLMLAWFSAEYAIK